MAEVMRVTVASMLKGIDRYNPENLATLERYVDIQARENAYDLEANLAVLKLYQFNPTYFQTSVAVQILLKALTNLPHTDFVLCKCLIDSLHLEKIPIQQIMFLHDLLEMCQFKEFWKEITKNPEIISGITGFEDSIRKFICHVVNITFQRIEKTVLSELLGGLSENQLKQWMNKYGWTDVEDGHVFITNQEENIKTKKITEKIDFDSVAMILASSR
ncbi:eukaryotic translation initiation factor 3 subunit K-like [Limulus polyphemus]|uniref:Eukaryotic translation initiation factor 3 subunit K n=1 Tax=Limulus polyphemus TaxID=6850 RepID=A0ABM1BQI3_LIMPO|nr:eukaryotic translation initiation factor 3 subunit K-like [Limulus polyphemus]XP_013786718.1 eukaryotic translation initiation factor 3 subunit K-like [Limulus polyphemus]